MGSVGNQNPWQTYDTYKDCSQGICSIYCPQWCYILFPPPPPFSFSDDGGGSGADFSPLIIAVIGIFASAFILVTYYTIISKYCRRRRSTTSGDSLDWANESWQGAGGLDESVIKSITVWKYKRSENSADGGDCSVCLTEFQENESVRLLPKCNHKFHLPCIDTWLRSHASCPLCRANILSPEIPPPANQDTGAPANTVSVSAQEYQYCGTNDSIIVVQNSESATENITARNEAICDGRRPVRRSASLNLNHSNGNLLSIADILLINDEDEEIREMEIKKIGIMKLIRSPLALKRSISTGRFMFLSSSYENRRNSLIPN